MTPRYIVMTLIGKGYDSDNSQDRCSYCGSPITRTRSRMIIGTGNSLMAIYHPACWELLLTESPSPEVKETEEGPIP